MLEAEFAPLKVTDIEPKDRCALEGIPRSNYRGNFEIIQSPGQVTILYTWNHAYRIIPIDGRQHAGAAIKLFNGHSVGRWEGNTLVVDVTNLNDLTWFDSHGTHHSDALHVVERWTIVDAKTINYEATMDDPKVFTRPWKIAFPMRRARGEEMYEEACLEGNDPTVEGTSSKRAALSRPKGSRAATSTPKASTTRSSARASPTNQQSPTRKLQQHALALPNVDEMNCDAKRVVAQFDIHLLAAGPVGEMASLRSD